jgi:hypothetical protein
MPKAKSPSTRSKLSIEQLALMDFEPWSHKPGDKEPPGKEEIAPALVWVRAAYAALFQTKAELQRFPEQLGDDEFFSLLKGIRDSKSLFQALIIILDTAETRLLAAGAVQAVRREGA